MQLAASKYCFRLPWCGPAQVDQERKISLCLVEDPTIDVGGCLAALCHVSWTIWLMVWDRCLVWIVLVEWCVQNSIYFQLALLKVVCARLMFCLIWQEVRGPSFGQGDDSWCSWCLWPAAKAGRKETVKAGPNRIAFRCLLLFVCPQVLMSYLATIQDGDLKHTSVLELGSGCGAVGMYAAKRGQDVDSTAGWHPSMVKGCHPAFSGNSTEGHTSLCPSVSNPFAMQAKRWSQEKRHLFRP